jgi:hypothetical protein
LINIVGGAPLVVKLLEGTQGIGVVLAETPQAANSVIEAFRNLDANILVQEFIKEAEGADIRAFVIGERVVAAMLRRGAPESSARTFIAAGPPRRSSSRPRNARPPYAPRAPWGSTSPASTFSDPTTGPSSSR